MYVVHVIYLRVCLLWYTAYGRNDSGNTFPRHDSWTCRSIQHPRRRCPARFQICMWVQLVHRDTLQSPWMWCDSLHRSLLSSMFLVRTKARYIFWIINCNFSPWTFVNPSTKLKVSPFENQILTVTYTNGIVSCQHEPPLLYLYSILSLPLFDEGCHA